MGTVNNNSHVTHKPAGDPTQDSTFESAFLLLLKEIEGKAVNSSGKAKVVEGQFVGDNVNASTLTTAAPESDFTVSALTADPKFPALAKGLINDPTNALQQVGEAIKNPYMKPSLTALLFTIMFEVALAEMMIKWTSGQTAAAQMVQMGKLDAESANYEYKAGMLEAQQHRIAAAAAWTSMAISIVSASATMHENVRGSSSEKGLNNETQKMKENPEYHAGKEPDPSGPGAFDAPTKSNYRLAKDDLAVQKEALAAEQAKPNPDPVRIKEINKKIKEDEDLAAKSAPGATQIEAEIKNYLATHPESPDNGNYGKENYVPKDPEVVKLNETKVATEKEINLRETSPAHRNELLQQRKASFTANVQMLSHVFTSLNDGIKEQMIATVMQNETLVKMMEKLIESMSRSTSRSADQVQSSIKEASDFLGQFYQWIQQYVETNTRIFGFSPRG